MYLIKALSSAAERFLHTEDAEGSSPSRTTHIFMAFVVYRMCTPVVAPVVRVRVPTIAPWERADVGESGLPVKQVLV